MIDNSKHLEKTLEFSFQMAVNLRQEYITPELILIGICVTNPKFQDFCNNYNIDIDEQIKTPIYRELRQYQVPGDVEEFEITPSYQMQQILIMAAKQAKVEKSKEVTTIHLILAILQLPDSFACNLLNNTFNLSVKELQFAIKNMSNNTPPPQNNDDNADCSYDIPDDPDFIHIDYPDPLQESKWTDLVTCINDTLQSHNPLIGRDAELERTIQILCRHDKNNPLHVGEPGVGKTALVYGLAQRIEDGLVPTRLKGARIYMLDMTTLLAGTQYRGEFENRIKNIMNGAAKQGNAIIYIDEIHTLIGAGATSGSSLDGSNILKPYLEDGTIRFIGATTYKEYNKYFQQSQGIVRRFQMIDIAEPSQDETIKILEGLKDRYEKHHGVIYNEGTMEYAVKMSTRYISNRFLPDKAIDLIDEAGAYRQLHPQTRKYKGETKILKIQHVGKDIIDDTLKRICKLTDESLSTTTDGNDRLLTLESRIKANIYGQDEAVRLSTEAVMMGKAGLLEQQKPISSLLFVGPTGVGKTEVCKVLAQELGVELIRFDMSEYTEKHTVAKLIGSPAGYVGYEDGGLLTDAIRKSPNCVLLLDEIEKAHSDIYNILLQVMDYACLTDNKGNKADFRNVILIMTSNAGAQHASQASIGFDNNSTRGQAMLQTVKKTFKPEFINRLSSIVVFNDMDKNMASLILDKKLRQLRQRLELKNITLQVEPEAYEYLLSQGFTRQYGAREIDRVLQTKLNPPLMREILFGKLKNGGKAIVTKQGDDIQIR